MEKEEYFKAEIIEEDGALRLRALDGSLSSQEFEVTLLDVAQEKQGFNVGEKVVVLATANPEGTQFTIVDYVRHDALTLLFVLFVFVAVIVGRKWGVASLVGMAFSFLVIFMFILPRIIAGGDPVFNTILGASFIVPVTFYMSHGFSDKTHVAIFSTIITLIIIGVLAAFFIQLAHLTGYAAEEAIFLQNLGEFNIRGILLSGIIIGSLGVLDDITISQASIVLELYSSNAKTSKGDLYRRAMNVGRDHIASLVNTLVLVYTGASLPLLLLFTESGRSFSDIINIEMVADEIVRTLAGSIGLIIAVPLTTFIAVYALAKK